MSDNIDEEEEFTINKRPGRKRVPDDQLKNKRRIRRIPVNTLEFDAKQKKIPKRFEAIFALMHDDRSPIGAVLTREQLDDNDVTKLLPKAEKDALFKYLPHWETSVTHARAIAQLRRDEIDRTTNAYKVADVLRKKGDFDSLSLPDQMKLTAAVMDKQIQESALVHAVTSVKEISTDETTIAMYRLRVSYIKDMFWIRNNLIDLVERLQETNMDVIEDGELIDETQRLLKVADQTLRGRERR